MAAGMSRTIVTLTVALLLISALGAQTPNTGTITGTVLLKSRVTSVALPSTAYPGRAVGPRSTQPIPEIRNVVVYVKDAAFRGELPTRKVAVQQEHETFIPHVVALTRGSTVD